MLVYASAPSMLLEAPNVYVLMYASAPKMLLKALYECVWWVSPPLSKGAAQGCVCLCLYGFSVVSVSSPI